MSTANNSAAPLFEPEEGDRFICTDCGHSFNGVDETVRPLEECPSCGEEAVQRVVDYLATGAQQ